MPIQTSTFKVMEPGRFYQLIGLLDFAPGEPIGEPRNEMRVDEGGLKNEKTLENTLWMEVYCQGFCV